MIRRPRILAGSRRSVEKTPSPEPPPAPTAEETSAQQPSLPPPEPQAGIASAQASTDPSPSLDVSHIVQSSSAQQITTGVSAPVVVTSTQHTSLLNPAIVAANQELKLLTPVMTNSSPQFRFLSPSVTNQQIRYLNPPAPVLNQQLRLIAPAPAPANQQARILTPVIGPPTQPRILTPVRTSPAQQPRLILLRRTQPPAGQIRGLNLPQVSPVQLPSASAEMFSALDTPASIVKCVTASTPLHAPVIDLEPPDGPEPQDQPMEDSPKEEEEVEEIPPPDGKSKKLVRKFCLVSPSPACPNGQSGPSRATGKVAAKIGGFMKLVSPRVLHTKLNITTGCIERTIFVPAREVTVTEVACQTRDGMVETGPRLLGPWEGAPSSPEPLNQQPAQPGTAGLKRSASEQDLITAEEVVKRLRGADPKETESVQTPATLNGDQAITTLNEKVKQMAIQDYKQCLQRDHRGNLRIHHAALAGDPLAVLRQGLVLRAAGVSVDVPNTRHMSALQLAVCSEGAHAEMCVRHLLRLGASPAARDRDGNTLLHLATLHGAPHNLKPLLKLCNPNCLNDDGFSPLHLAALWGKPQHSRLLLHIEDIDVDLQDMHSGRTALFHATERGGGEVCRQLAAMKASTRIPNFAGQMLATLITEASGQPDKLVPQMVCSVAYPRKRKNTRERPREQQSKRRDKPKNKQTVKRPPPSTSTNAS